MRRRITLKLRRLKTTTTIRIQCSCGHKIVRTISVGTPRTIICPRCRFRHH